MRTTIEVVQDMSEFSDQREPWDALASRTGNPLLSHAWVLSAAESFGGQVHVVEVWQENRIVAAAPLVRRSSDILGQLEIPGAATLFEPSGFLFESDAALVTLCGWLAAASVPLLLHRMDRADPTVAALEDATRGRGWWIRQDGGGCPFISLPETWQAYLQSRSPQRRYDLRRARRRLEAHGTVSFRCLAPPDGDVGLLLESVFSLEASGWKGRTGSAINHRPAMREFFLRYARRAAKSGQLRVCFLDLDGYPIAAELAVEVDRRFWVLKIGFDERWARCSPGLQLLCECVRMSIEQACGSHEFLGTDEPWIRPWADASRPLQTLRYYPRNWRGVCCLGRDQSGRVHALADKVTWGRRRSRGQTVPERGE